MNINDSGLLPMLDQFLKDRIPAIDSYAVVSSEDFMVLGAIFNTILNLKFEKDCDGDLPVNFRLANRHIERFISPVTVPYKSIPSNIKGIAQGIETLAMELSHVIDYNDLEKKVLESTHEGTSLPDKVLGSITGRFIHDSKQGPIKVKEKINTREARMTRLKLCSQELTELLQYIRNEYQLILSKNLPGVSTQCKVSDATIIRDFILYGE